VNDEWERVLRFSERNWRERSREMRTMVREEMIEREDRVSENDGEGRDRVRVRDR
jgi:hypothetical protein